MRIELMDMERLMVFPPPLCNDYWICFRGRAGVTLLCYEMPFVALA